MDTRVAESQEGATEAYQTLDLEDEDGSDVDIDVGSAPEEKDETEEELEQLVFGDSAGFREGLKNFRQAATTEDEDDQDVTGLEGLDDGDVGQALVARADSRACG